MTSLKVPTAIPRRQMNLLFESSRLEGLEPVEREKIVTALAQILMLAVGLRVVEFDDDKH